MPGRAQLRRENPASLPPLASSCSQTSSSASQAELNGRSERLAEREQPARLSLGVVAQRREPVGPNGADVRAGRRSWTAQRNAGWLAGQPARPTTDRVQNSRGAARASNLGRAQRRLQPAGLLLLFVFRSSALSFSTLRRWSCWPADLSGCEPPLQSVRSLVNFFIRICSQWSRHHNHRGYYSAFRADAFACPSRKRTSCTSKSSQSTHRASSRLQLLPRRYEIEETSSQELRGESNCKLVVEAACTLLSLTFHSTDSEEPASSILDPRDALALFIQAAIENIDILHYLQATLPNLLSQLERKASKNVSPHSGVPLSSSVSQRREWAPSAPVWASGAR